MAYVEEAQQGAGQRPGDREEGQEPEIKDHLRHEQHQEFSMRVEGFLKIIAFMYRAKRILEEERNKRGNLPSRRWSRWRWPWRWARRCRWSRPRPRCRGLVTMPPRRTRRRKPPPRRPPRAGPAAPAGGRSAGHARATAGAAPELSRVAISRWTETRATCCCCLLARAGGVRAEQLPAAACVRQCNAGLGFGVERDE